MEETKEEALARLQGAGLTPEVAAAFREIILGKGEPVMGGVVPPAAPGEPAPRVLVRPERVLTKEQAQALEKAFPVSGSVEVQGESGWGSRKLWVALATLAGMLAQVPLEKRLSAHELIAVACVAVAYIVMQGLVDIAKVRANDQGPAA